MRTHLAFLLLIPLALCFLPGRVQAQPAGGDITLPAGPQAPGGGAIDLTPEPEEPADTQGNKALALWQDVLILQIIRNTGMTPAQMQAAVPLLSGVQDKARAFRQLEDTLWVQSSSSIKAVCETWAAGVRADDAQKTAADSAVKQHDDAKADLDNTIRQVADQIRGSLNRDQSSLIETAQDETGRLNIQATLGGAPSLADFIARRMQVLRGLMPDEYRHIRIVEAQEIAALIVGPRSRDLDNETRRVLDALDAAQAWTDDQFRAKQPGLADLVAKALNLPPASSGQVKRADFLDFVGDPRTLQLITQLSGGATAPPPEPAPRPRDMETAMTVARHLAILNDLQTTVDQLSLFATLADRQRGLVRAYDANYRTRRAQFQAQLQTARGEFVAGSQLDEVAAAAVQTLQAGDASTRAKDMEPMIDNLAAVQRTLTPAQNGLIDWRLPLRLQSPTALPQETADAKRIAAAMLVAVDFLNDVRYGSIDIYLATRTNKIENYLRRYIDPQSRDWPRLRQYMFDITDQSKQVQEPKWNAAAPIFAARILRTLGIAQPPAERVDRNRRYDWDTMYELFSYPKTGDLMRHMVALRQPPPK